MITFHPLVPDCPPDIQGNCRRVMQVAIVGRLNGLAPFNAQKIAQYAELKLGEVAVSVAELAERKLIQIEEWV